MPLHDLVDCQDVEFGQRPGFTVAYGNAIGKIRHQGGQKSRSHWVHHSSTISRALEIAGCVRG